MKRMCEVCSKREAVILCDACGKALCSKCYEFEVWGVERTDFIIKHFCSACKEDPDINPWGAFDKAAGIEELIDNVRNIMKQTDHEEKRFLKAM